MMHRVIGNGVIDPPERFLVDGNPVGGEYGDKTGVYTYVGMEPWLPGFNEILVPRYRRAGEDGSSIGDAYIEWSPLVEVWSIMLVSDTPPFNWIGWSTDGDAGTLEGGPLSADQPWEGVDPNTGSATLVRL